MSKRPIVTPGPLGTRLSRGRLRDLPIWSKLGLIMIVPILATITVGAVGISRNVESANDANRTRSLSILAMKASAFVHELQNERASVVHVLGGVGGNSVAKFESQSKVTDMFLNMYRNERVKSIDGLPNGLLDRLDRIDVGMAELPKMRQQIAKPQTLTLTVALTRYGTLISDLLSIREEAASLIGSGDIANKMRSTTFLTTLKEKASQERVVILTALTRKAMTSLLRKDYQLAVIGQDQARFSFNSSATTWQREQFNQYVVGPDLRESLRFRSTIEQFIENQNTGDDQLPADIFTVQQWDNAMAGKNDLFRKAETEIDQKLVSDTYEARSALGRQVTIEISALLAMLLLSLVFAWMVARSMARALRELRHGALIVAQYGLPQAVEKLRDPNLIAQYSPKEVAERLSDPLPIRSADEFGQLAEAFNAVHLEAVRMAAEQALLRSSIATMFVNLARRSQILVDRLIGHLDRLERGEEDPDRLSELFQLDHLATRMRRNDENLLVLAGADSTRVQRDPATLMDVLRAAQSEVEHYTRIEFGEIDRGIEVGAHAVNDLVHLVAELLDNATAFSPPDSAVTVSARRIDGRAVLMVEDHGIGMAPDQLAEHNERLANPPVVDVTVSRMMGLVVVARLAVRHGIRAELRAATERGTVAELIIPSSVLAPRALGGGRAPEVLAQNQLPALPHGSNADLFAKGAPPTRQFGMAGDTSSDMSRTHSFNAFGASPPSQDSVTDSFTTLSASPSGAETTPSSPHHESSLWSEMDSPEDSVSAQSTSPIMNQWGSPEENQFAGSSDATAIIPRQRSELPQRAPMDSLAPEDNDLFTPQSEEIQPPAWPPTPVAAVPSPPQVRMAPPAPPPHPPVAVSAPQPDVSESSYADRPTSPYATLSESSYADLSDSSYADRQGSPYADQPEPSYADRPASPYADLSDSSYADRPASPYADLSEPSYADRPDSSYASDMTAEIPAVRLDWEPAPAEDDGSSTSEHRFVDETMELPIYRELESAWFNTQPVAHSANSSPSDQGEADLPTAGRMMASSHERDSFSPVSIPSSATDMGPTNIHSDLTAAGMSAGRSTAAPTSSWQTAADEGWQAAAALVKDQDFTITETGLPKRVPMSQLVPGGVERTPASSHRRTPEAVRGLLSAYHRGVQRGRTQSTVAGEGKIPEPSTAGPHTSQGGKEYEA